MKKASKFIVSILIGTLVAGATLYGFAWFEALASKSQDLTIEVVTPEDMEVSVKSTFGDGKLTPIHGSAVAWKDQDGNDTTAYYGEVLTCTFEGQKMLYFDGFECSEELGKAVRVEIDHKLYGIAGYTDGLTMNGLDIAVSTGSSLGQYTDTAELTCRIFLEGEDAACVRDNMTDELDITLNFHVE